MKQEVREFIMSIKSEHVHSVFKGDDFGGVIAWLPYIGYTKIDDSTTIFQLVELIYQAGFNGGVATGKYELANDMKKLLQINADE